jgi:hypothetical protein
MLQLRFQNDLRLKFRPKTVVVLYQDSRYHEDLLELQRLIGAGYVYKRRDKMSELRIEGHTQVRWFLTQVQRYVRFKRKQLDLMLQAIAILKRGRLTADQFLEVCTLADRIAHTNYSHNRKYTATYVHSVFVRHKLIPVTTDPRLGGVR